MLGNGMLRPFRSTRGKPCVSFDGRPNSEAVSHVAVLSSVIITSLLDRIAFDVS